jgi:hydroxymethylpyrimidine pyrophosphatase-like HAD family hydrolase
MRDIAAELGIDGTAICSNGALVVDLATQRIVRQRLLESEVALELVHALRGDDVVAVSLDEATAELKTVPPEWYAVAQAFFG